MLTAASALFLMAPGLGNVTVGDGSATLAMGAQPVGDRFGGATLLWEQGDPEAPTNGNPTDPPIAGLELLARYTADGMPAAGDGTWAGNTAGADLIGTNQGTPTKNGRHITAAHEYAYPNLNAWRAANTTDTDNSVGTRDFVVLAVVRGLSTLGTNDVVVSTQHSGDPGYELRRNSSSIVCSYRGPTVGAVNDVRTAAIDTGAWAMIGCIYDRDGYFAAWGTDRGSGAAEDISAGSANTLDSATYKFTIGRDPGGGNEFGGEIAFVEVWACPSGTPDCLTLGAAGQDYDTDLVAYRDKVFGSTALDDGALVTTSIATRNSSAYARVCDVDTDDMVLELYADHIPRVEYLCGTDWDSFTSATIYKGYAHEATLNNVITDYEDPTAVGWTKTNTTATADASCGGTLFAHDSTCHEMRAADTSNVSHEWSYAGPNTAEEDHAFAALKAGAVNYAIITAGGTNWVKWDLTDCSIAAQGAGVDFAGDWAFRNGWCWLGMSGGAAIATVTIIACDVATASGTCSYAAGDTASAQIEFRQAIATANVNDEHGYQSPEVPGGRTQDIMEFPMTLPAGAMTIVLDGVDMRNDSIVDLSVLSDNDANVFAMSKNALKTRTYGDTATVRDMEIASSTDFPTLGRHIHRASWAADDAKLYLDGTLEGTDTNTNGNEPAAYQFIYYGKTNASDDRHHGSILNIRVYQGAWAPGEGGTGDDDPAGGVL